MPVIAAIVGAVLTGLFYWLIWGKGLEYIEHSWRQSSDRRRDSKRRAAAVESQKLAAVRSITDQRDAAAVLMLLVAQQRGVLTPEQAAAIEQEMREVLEFPSDELPKRLAFARFAAQQVTSGKDGADAVAPLLRAKLDGSEKTELSSMMRRVAEVHGGPTDEQENYIAYTERRLLDQS